MIHFITPTTLDLRCITTFGVNVKLTDSAIGYFGTGLKYAIAVLLREGAKVTMQTGGKSYEFTTKVDQIRGKDFSLCYMNDIALPFTLELGKDWTLENAYRELYSNTKDEGGSVYDNPPANQWDKDDTIISVDLEAFTEVHERRSDFILEEPKHTLFASAVGEILPFPNQQVFYRGIAAFKLSRASAFTYNILDRVALTENRTMYSWEVETAVAKLLATCSSAKILRSALLDESKYEHGISFDYVSTDKTFMETVGELAKTNGAALNASAAKTYFRSATGPIAYDKAEATFEQANKVYDAVKKCNARGIHVDTYEIVLSPYLGENVLARAYQGKIWLTPACFATEELLLHALLEEYIHLRYGVADMTRQMQNAIFTVLVHVVQDSGETGDII